MSIYSRVDVDGYTLYMYMYTHKFLHSEIYMYGIEIMKKMWRTMDPFVTALWSDLSRSPSN